MPTDPTATAKEVLAEQVVTESGTRDPDEIVKLVTPIFDGDEPTGPDALTTIIPADHPLRVELKNKAAMCEHTQDDKSRERRMGRLITTFHRRFLPLVNIATGEVMAVNRWTRQSHPITSTALKDLLLLAHLEDHALAAPNREVLEDTLSLLRGLARRHEVQVRERVLSAADHPADVIWVNLHDQSRVVKVTGEGWQLVPRLSCPHIFSANFAIPRPERRLVNPFRHMNLHLSAEDRLVVRAWLVSVLNQSPTPILVLHGPPGGGKSTLARLLLTTLGLSDQFLQPHQLEKLEDFQVAASKVPALALDNLRSLTRQQSDVLCTIVTGGSLKRRKLYTDDEAVTVWARCGLIVTSITPEIGTEPDLLDRCFFVELTPPDQKEYQSEAELEEKMSVVLPEMAGMVLDDLAFVLQHRHLFTPVGRMGDFSRSLQALMWGQGVSVEEAANEAGEMVRKKLAAVATSEVFGALIESLEQLALVEGETFPLSRLVEVLKVKKPAGYGGYWPSTIRGVRSLITMSRAALLDRGWKVDVRSERNDTLVELESSTPDRTPPGPALAF